MRQHRWSQRPEPGRDGRQLLLFLAGGGLAGWEGFQSWSTRSAHWSVALIIVGAVGVAVAAGIGRQALKSRRWLSSSSTSVRTWRRDPTRYGAAVIVWIVLFFSVAGLDVYALLRGSQDVPTLSRLVGDVTSHPLGRAAFFAVWMIVGAYLALAGRRSASPPIDAGPAPAKEVSR
jgi:hypothetical protein